MGGTVYPYEPHPLGSLQERVDHAMKESPTEVDVDNLDAFMAGAKLYRKKKLTRAVRMHGPFTVETREGSLTCQDGYLAVDNAGYPYPIDHEEFVNIYEVVDEE